MEAELPVVWLVMDNAAFGTIAGLESMHYGWSFGCLVRAARRAVPRRLRGDGAVVRRARRHDPVRRRTGARAARGARRPTCRRSFRRRWKTRRRRRPATGTSTTSIVAESRCRLWLPRMLAKRSRADSSAGRGGRPGRRRTQLDAHPAQRDVPAGRSPQALPDVHRDRGDRRPRSPSSRNTSSACRSSARKTRSIRARTRSSACRRGGCAPSSCATTARKAAPIR